MHQPSSSKPRSTFIAFVAAAAVALVAAIGLAASTMPATGSFTELSGLVASGEVAALEVDGERVTARLPDGAAVAAVVASDAARNALVERALDRNVAVEFVASFPLLVLCGVVRSTAWREPPSARRQSHPVLRRSKITASASPFCAGNRALRPGAAHLRRDLRLWLRHRPGGLCCGR